MDPKIAKTGTTGAGQTADGRTLSPQPDANQAAKDLAAQRAKLKSGPTQSGQGGAQEGASFGGPGTPGTQGTQQQRNPGYPGSNST
jgi:hypothetical protein